jgi:HlyD family secretion protein
MRPRAVLVGLAAVLVAAALLLAFRGRGGAPRLTVVPVDRGDIADVVGATGVLQAVTTVQVGSQVSGTISELLADFNSNVRKGQVIARLDPSLFEARVAQTKANLVSAQADVEKARAAIADTKQKYERAKQLATQNLVPDSDLDSAKAAYDGAVAQLQAAQAAVSQAAASLNQAQVDLSHTVITAPIDGVVLARNVDVGQTVAASFTAPVLFVIANDLTHMEVNASIDEADIGRVRQGQTVTFHVDAYPDETFQGRLEQVRLQPVSANNVVTYNTIVAVDNKSLRLMPGMTATVSVIIQERKGVVRLPAAALRFRPEGYEDLRRGGGVRPASAEGGAPPGVRTAAGAPGPTAGPGSPGGAGAGSGEGRRRRSDAAPAGDGADGQGGAQDGTGEGRPGRPGVVFVPDEKGQPKPMRVRLGISDGRYVEVVEGLEEGQKVVTGAEGARTPGPAPSSSTNNPFQPRFQPRTR